MKNLKTILLIIISILIFECENSYSQVIQDWVKNYSSTQLNNQIPYDAVTDTLGNIYITGSTSRGYSSIDMVTIKYNSSGVYLWGKTFNASVTDYSNETGRSIALYRTGDSTFIYSVGLNTTANNVIIIKYNQNGKQIWQKTYSSSPSGYTNTTPKVIADASGNCIVSGGNGQAPYVIKYNSAGTLLFNSVPANPSGYTYSKWNDAVLDASGNIYNTGDCDSSSAKYYYTSKYNSAGVLQWSKIFRGSPLYQSKANKIAVGASGVYVTGEFNSGATDYLTIKYNSSTGDTLWTRKFNGTANTSDHGKLIALDAGENVYVSGITNYTTAGDIATVKYNSSGVQQWVRTYAGAGGYLDEPRDITVDISGNIIIAGASDLSLFGKTLSIKYNTNGDSLWVKLFDVAVTDYEYPYAMTMDNSGNIIITGSSGYENNADFGTIKYNSSGTLQWMKKFYGAQIVNDGSNGAVTDKNGNIYTVGRTRTNYGDNISVIKYNSAGTQLWVYDRGDGGAGYNIYDEGKAITVDTNCNVYITGTVYLYAVSKQDVFTAKLDSNGNALWFIVTASNNGDDAGNAIDADNSGNVYIAGQNTGAAGDLNYVTMKYNSAGVVQWTKYAGLSGLKDVPNSIAVDGSGNVFVTGNADSTGSGQDILTVKYNSAGTQQWIKRINGSSNSTDAGNSIAVDKGGNAYICGMISQTVGNDVGIIVKYKNDASGTKRWEGYVNLTATTGAETLVSLKLDTSKTKIYAAGSSYGSGVFNTNYTLSKFDSAGNQQWQKVYDHPGSFYDVANGLALDKNENSYVTGITNTTTTDFLTVSYNSAGTFRWFKTFNGNSNGEDFLIGNNQIAVDKNGNVYVAGSSYDTLNGDQITTVKYKQSSFTLNLTSFIEGLYNSVSNSMISDTVKVCLRSTVSPYNQIDSVKGILSTSGTGTFYFSNAADGINYYIVVKHRNGLETWSSAGNSFTSGSMTYDFSTAANKSYGSNQMQADASPSRYAFYSGDVNKDGYIDLTDVIYINNDANNFSSGYIVSDITGNNITDLTDVIMAYNNANIFVSVKKP